MFSEELPSIHQLAPIEQGGSSARRGFFYQDHIAARFCIRMLQNSTLTEVWCETLDDITLLWNDNDKLVVEFVQVKAHDLNQMWSIALLCEGGAASIVARSLSQHRCRETCRFRIVTRSGVNSDLRVLRLSLEHQDRQLSNGSTRSLHKTVSTTFDDLYSPAGWSASNWLQHTLWDVSESEAAVTFSNLWELECWLEDNGEVLFRDQIQELYNLILARVVKISALPKDITSEKKLARGEYLEWVMSESARLRGSTSTRAGRNLTSKMTLAQIPDGVIQNALDLKRAYRKRMLDPKYQQTGDYKQAELEITAILQQLLAELDAGLVTMNGPAFHADCLSAIASVSNRFSSVELSFLHGAMYSMTDRCRHRFRPTALP